MNTLSLILKNMRQRALSTLLTTLSVALGVALAIAVIIVHREGDKLFVQSDFGYNLLVGPKGDELRLVLNSAYGLGSAQSSINLKVYDDLMRNQRQYVRSAIPFMVGDTWHSKRIMAIGNRVVGSPQLTEFRAGLKAAGESLRSLGDPPKSGDVSALAARRVKIPAGIAELKSQIQELIKKGDGLDIEFKARLREIAESVGRAEAMIDPAKPAMTDAAGLIASDAVDQVRMLESFSAPLEYRSGRAFEIASGRAFHAEKFEGILGAKAAQQLQLKLGDPFHLEHGGDPNDVHTETWTVVGILKPTGTAMDDTVFIPIVTGWAIPAHMDAMEQMAHLGLSDEQIEKIKADYQAAGEKLDIEAHDHGDHHDEADHKDADPHDADHHDADHHDADHHDADHHDAGDHATSQPADDGLMTAATTHEAHDDHAAHAGEAHAGHDDHDEHAYHMDGDRIHLELPPELRKISGIFVTARDGFATQTLQFRFRNLPDAMAVSPAKQMADFFNTFMKGPAYIVLGLAILVTVVAAVSILVSIYNAVSARKREIAILRALGATRDKVLAIICLEAMLVGLIGSIIGLVLGHAIAAVGGMYLQKAFGQQLAYHVVSGAEFAYVAGVVLMAGLAGLVPAMQAYRTSVATNLAGE